MMKPFGQCFFFILISLLSMATPSCNRSVNDMPDKPQAAIKDSVPTSTDTTSNNKTDSTGQNDTTQKVETDPKVMKFEIVFESQPGNATATIAKLKYNKFGWVSVEWDDNSPNALTALGILKNKFYTDGCGNKIMYAGALAVNGRNQYSNDEAANIPNNVNYAQMLDLISKGWDIENHSYYHEPGGNYNYGEDRNRNVKELDELLVTRIKYKMNGLVVPTNYDGFPTAAKNYGYLFSTSQGTHDGFAPAGKPVYKDVQDFALAPENFSAFNRMFFDDWGEMERGVTKAINEIAIKSFHYFRFASHTIDEAAFIRIMNHFEQTTNDKILMAPTREVMEYRLMAKMPVTYSLSGNKLTVEVNTATLPDRFRWRDLSFNVSSDKKIKEVNIINAIDKTSFNSNTGLVNIFKQVTQWN